MSTTLLPCPDPKSYPTDVLDGALLAKGLKTWGSRAVKWARLHGQSAPKTSTSGGTALKRLAPQAGAGAKKQKPCEEEVPDAWYAMVDDYMGIVAQRLMKKLNVQQIKDMLVAYGNPSSGSKEALCHELAIQICQETDDEDEDEDEH